MKHLDEFTLNEYLDHALDESIRDEIETHLQSCVACRAKLDELQAVFTELDALPEVHLERDLTPSILARLSQKTPIRVWTRAFAAQLGVAIGLVFWTAMQAIRFYDVPQVEIPRFPTLDMQALFTRLLSVQVELPQLALPEFALQLPSFEFQIPTPSLDISSAQVIALAISSLLLWIVGNAVLLRSRQETSS